MNDKTASKDSVGYHGDGAGIAPSCSISTHTTSSTCTGAGGIWSGRDYYCGANKLGYRLANCSATRYVYWIDRADEHSFLAIAYARSDKDVKRIFPGCKGNRVVGAADSSVAVGTAPGCSGVKATDMPEAGGDAHCLDQDRVVFNFRDIVEDPLCVN